MRTRILDWDGLRNVRDLGGLRTPQSATGLTRFGQIARGPRREMLTAAGWRAAADWGLRSVVDLRSADETGSRASDPDARPPTQVTITLAPTEDQSHPEFREVCLPILDSPEYWRHNVRILPQLVRGSLEAIADAEPGVLVHCAAGRDRTGMICAVLLATAGVSTEDIVDDYAESVRAMAGTAPHGGPTPDRQSTWTPDQVAAWLADVTVHVRSFVEDASSVLDELEIGDGTRRRLRELLIG